MIRGAKVRSDLAFLNKTEMPAILIEHALDSTADIAIYDKNFDLILRSGLQTRWWARS